MAQAWNNFGVFYSLIKTGDNLYEVVGVTYRDDQGYRVFDDNLGVFQVGDKVFKWDEDDDKSWHRYIGHYDDGIVLSWRLLHDRIDTDPDKAILVTRDYGLEIGDTFSPVLESIALCFLVGTLIGFPGGERPVEDLAIGDVVSTADGGTRRVKWIGRQTVMPRFADPLHGRPIRIRANALADGVPSRDLCVSPDHALLVDGSLVQAGALVDGVAVERMSDLPERFVYFHVEVDDHALILAENTPAETFVDNVTRRRFDNWREYEELYGEEELDVVELELPRVRSSRQLPRPIATRLAARARRLFGGRRRGTAA